MFQNKNILVTGGTGTIGKAFVQRALKLQANKVIVFSRDEFKQHEMAKEITDPRVVYLLGDVRDKESLLQAFNNVDIVVHTAAIKHVPAAEANPQECIKTNVIGSTNIIEAAIERGVSRVVAISTDKAVNPISLYGASKLCMEKLLIAANGKAPTVFSIVRSGNLLGSNGSVLPLFLKCRASDHIYPITDPEMTRFWSTVDQVIDLILVAISSYGAIYVPKLPSSNLVELVKALDPEEYHIKIIGARPGEKQHEALIAEEEMGWEAKDYYVISGPEGPKYKIGPYTSNNNSISQNQLYSHLQLQFRD